MHLEHKRIKNRGKFIISDMGYQVAVMTYIYSNTKELIIDKTLIDDEYADNQLGPRLLRSVVEFARSNKLKINASCPFAKKVIQITTKYSDVLVLKNK